MKKAPVIVKAVSGFCVLSIALMLCSGCLSFVFAHDPSGQMYEADAVKAHFSAWGFVYIVLLLILILMGAISYLLKKTPAGNEKRQAYRRAKPMGARITSVVRAGLFLVSAGLILLGIVNGGLRDVFVKAVNICTECIGLG